jgi:hypothetical protein
MRLSQRVERLEASAGFGEIRYRLRNGARASIRRRELLTALSEATTGVHSRRAMVLLNADDSNGGLPNLVQAIAAGPVPHGEVNE